MGLNILCPADEEIRCRLSDQIYFPPLCLSLQGLIAILQEETDSVEKLERIIRYDPGLTAALLRIANSAYYGFRCKVSSISRAVMTIGFRRTKALCLGPLLIEYFSDRNILNGKQKEEFWKHSIATARIADLLAQQRPWITREEAYTLGLLHDLGNLGMAVCFSDYYQSLQKIAESRKIPVWYLECQQGLSHTKIGRWIAQKWALPELYQRVFEYHHEPEESPSYRPEVRLTALANLLAQAHQNPNHLEDGLADALCRKLYIQEEEWESFLDRMDEIWEEVDALWRLMT